MSCNQYVLHRGGEQWANMLDYSLYGIAVLLSAKEHQATFLKAKAPSYEPL